MREVLLTGGMEGGEGERVIEHGGRMAMNGMVYSVMLFHGGDNGAQTILNGWTSVVLYTWVDAVGKGL